MDTLTDLLKQFPALWVVVGAFIVGAIVFVLARKAFALSGAAQDRLIGILEASVKTLEAERDNYRKQAHDCRDDAHALSLKLKEAESRPDLTRLFEAQQKEADRRYEVYTQQTELIARQSEVLAGIATMQQKLVADFEQHQKDNAERQNAMTSLLQSILIEAKKNGKRRRIPKP